MSKKPKEFGMIYNQTNKISFVLFSFACRFYYQSMFYKSSPVHLEEQTGSLSSTSCCLCSATVVLMPFVAFGSDLVWLISVRSVTVQLLFLSVYGYDLNRVIIIIFQLFYSPGPPICFCGKMLCFLSRLFVFLSFLWHCSSLKAMQCVKSRS